MNNQMMHIVRYDTRESSTWIEKLTMCFLSLV